MHIVPVSSKSKPHFFPKKSSHMASPRANRVLQQKKVRVRTYAVAVASARTRYLHCCVSRLFVFYVKSVEFLEKYYTSFICFLTEHLCSI